jgi:hypothetical protein
MAILFDIREQTIYKYAMLRITRLAAVGYPHQSVPPVRDIIPKEHLSGSDSFLKEIEDRLRVSF